MDLQVICNVYSEIPLCGGTSILVSNVPWNRRRDKKRLCCMMVIFFLCLLSHAKYCPRLSASTDHCQNGCMHGRGRETGLSQELSNPVP